MKRTNQRKAMKPGGVPGFPIPLYRLADGRTAFRDKYGGPARVRSFTDEAKARAEAEKLANRVLSGMAVRHSFGPEEIAIFRRAQEITQGHETPILAAVEEWAAAKRECGTRTVLEVVQAGMSMVNMPRKTFREVLALFLAAKRLEGVSQIYYDELDEDLGQFAKAHGDRPIAEIGTQDISGWLAGLTYKGRLLSPRRRNNIRATLVTLFRFAQNQQPALLPPGLTAPQRINKAKDKRSGAVTVFTPAEMRWWLANVRDEFLPWIAIGGFSGVRTEEICPPPESEKDRLRWDDFNWAKRHINVRVDVSKTGERRLVPIPDNLFAWLTPWHSSKGHVIPFGKRTDREAARLSRVSKRLTLATEKDPTRYHHPCPGLTWRHNALRHSACSYRMAMIKNAPQVAYEAGNSVAMIKRHYHEAQEEDTAKAWFAIMPGEAVDKTIQFPLGL